MRNETQLPGQSMIRSEIVVVCSPYLSPYLSHEISRLGYPVASVDHLTTVTSGTIEDAMKLNLYLRTANRVLFLIRRFKAADADDLYYQALKINWDEIFDTGSYIHIHSTVKNKTIRDNRFANLKLKDAVADFFMKKYNKRPDSGPDKSRSVIFLHWNESECSVYLDTSGETIAKHGYRVNPWKAPMIESLAASVIDAAKWDRNSHFVNPMCGSGTLAIEAAMMAANIAPGLLRNNFGFMHCKYYDFRRWKELKEEAKKLIQRVSGLEIFATDIDKLALEAAKENAEKAGVAKYISFLRCDFKFTPIPEGAGTVILNPEYGARLGETQQLENTYKEIGDFFKQKCAGYTGYIFSGNPDLVKKIGLKARQKLPFLNGKIECRLLQYELYHGSKSDMN